jgi:molecular chaperone DnaK
LQRLKEACEKAKCELSAGLETQINLPFITADASGPKHLMQTLSRAKFESLSADLFERCKIPCRQALKDAGLSPADVDEVLLVGGSTRIPKVQEIVEDVFQREANRSMNPDEVVAMGASIQGGVLAGDVDDLVLLDVTPLSLGIETMGRVMSVLIERNTTIPTSKKEVFTTAQDHQPEVEVHVLQGERPMAPDNRTLDRFKLDGLPSAPRGVPQIEVEFDIDSNGILHVTATDKATGKEHKVKIEQSTGVTEEDIERMQEEAERFKEQDEAAKAIADQRNAADQAAWQARKMLKDHEDKIEEDDRKLVEEKADALEELLKGDDLSQLDAQVAELQEVLSKVGEKLYQTAGAPAGGPEGAPQNPQDSGDQVVDADYEVKE